MRYYKFLNRRGRAPYSYYMWPPPTPDGPGEWTPFIDDIEMRVRGYHVCGEHSLYYWVNEEMYVAEVDGYTLKDSSKVVAQRARLIKRVDSWNAECAIKVARYTVGLVAMYCGLLSKDIVEFAEADTVNEAVMARIIANKTMSGLSYFAARVCESIPANIGESLYVTSIMCGYIRNSMYHAMYHKVPELAYNVSGKIMALTEAYK